MAVALMLILLLVLLAFGVPVAFSLLISGALGLYVIGGPTLVSGILETSTYSAINSYEFITIPLFILMAHFLIVSGISNNLFEAAAIWLGRVRAGLAIATTLSGAAFGAISGSSTASAATLASTSIPAMIKQGYDRRFASGIVAISGTLAMLIPPSVGIIFYGLLTETSIARLLIAGIVPGLLVALTIIMTALGLSYVKPGMVPGGKSYSTEEKIRSLKVLAPFVSLFGLVTGSIYFGVATPVEASAFGAFGAMLLAMVARKLTVKNLLKALFSTARTTAMIALIIICAQIFSYFLTLTQTTQGLVFAVGNSDLPGWAIIAAIIVIYIILGCILDLISILVLTIPVVFPIVMALGVDPIWFGIIVILTAEVGLVTPPVGLNVFVVSKHTNIPVADVFRGVSPHIVTQILLIVLLCLFPSVILWLPGMMAN